MLDSFIKASKTYYPQRLLEECKFNKTEDLTNDKLESSSSDDESDNESDNE